MQYNRLDTEALSIYSCILITKYASSSNFSFEDDNEVRIMLIVPEMIANLHHQ